MSEQDMWKKLKEAAGSEGRWDRLESHYTSPGVPDVDYTLDGVTGHIEMKYSSGAKFKVRPTQMAWFRRELEAGGRAFLLALIERQGRTDWILIHINKAEDALLNPNPTHWIKIADCKWRDKIIWDELKWRLTNEWKPK